MDAFIGEIRAFPYTFEPQDWALCDGRSMPVVSYQALYSIIRNTYGGDTNNFKLPDLRGETLMGSGQAPGLTQRIIGQKTGEQQVTLTLSQSPAHSHSINGATGAPTSRTFTPAANSLLTNFSYNKAGTLTNARGYLTNTPPDVLLNILSVSSVGGNPNGTIAAHENRQPFLSIGYFICVSNGVYPIKP